MVLQWLSVTVRSSKVVKKSTSVRDWCSDRNLVRIQFRLPGFSVVQVLVGVGYPLSSPSYTVVKDPVEDPPARTPHRRGRISLNMTLTGSLGRAHCISASVGTNGQGKD